MEVKITLDYYIENDNRLDRFFLEKNLLLNETKSGTKILIKDKTSLFSVIKYNGSFNIICVNDENELFYVIKNGEDKKKIRLSGFNKEIDIKAIKICNTRSRLDFIMSAKINDEVYLVHCVLGNNSKPYIIDRMVNEYFYFFNNKIYYTNSSGIMGFQCISDGKPDRFVKLKKDAFFPYAFNLEGKENIIYTDHKNVYMNNDIVYSGKIDSAPIMCYNHDGVKLCLEQGHILIHSSMEKGKFSKFERYILSELPRLSSVQKGDFYYYTYDIFI